MIWVWMAVAALGMLLLLVLYPKFQVELELRDGLLYGKTQVTSTIGLPLFLAQASIQQRYLIVEMEAPLWKRKMRAKLAALLLSHKPKEPSAAGGGIQASQTLLEHIQFKEIWLDATLAGPDAAQAAMRCAALRLAVQQADLALAVHHPEARRNWRVDADFQGLHTALEVGCIARLWIWHIIAAAISAKRKKGS